VWFCPPLSTIKNMDYNEYKFHDSLIHGFNFSVEDLNSQLNFDIDFIISWPSCASLENEFYETKKFKVSRGLLKFFDVTDLLVKIEWGDSKYTSGGSAEFINKIARRPVKTTLRVKNYYLWNIITNSKSVISFGASSYDFDLLGKALFVERQFLMDSERV
jgi:hypothetical protein